MLHIDNISIDLGEFRLDEASLDVAPGEYLVILGPTGAGKTILLETIGGLYTPRSGSISINGRQITNRPPKERNICMVYQDFMLFPHLTVEENIVFGLRSRKTDEEDAKKKGREMARLLAIDHLLHRYPDTLSGGEQQRTAIARALVMEPNLLLLDEPLSALDAQTRESLVKELKRIQKITKVTVLHVTHNFEEVFALADRVAVMNRGRIVQVGPPDEVFRKPNSEFIAHFTGTKNIFRGVCSMDSGASTIRVGTISIASRTCREEGEVYATIRPEDILVSRTPITSSARNSLFGTITGIANNGMFVKLTVDAGVPIVSVLTRQGFEEMDLDIGDEVYLTFKAAAVHVF
ncbi:MAG TPA: tungstate ABC transporter ATP-binding protein WtpC [Methanoregulaceae archaeon]|jgi:molybdate transport system ATP-binding protein/molybdate/tungstate transport system ATP-binding protein|nr:ABC transporter ATP-binding protein [Methanolinea sp.]HOP67461.1 tungstate ABC transporter ATP-binding protein WtpC [Methanoregulaceae archaeon]HPJ74690.1 tungstate ABC transporter ATP-binding protein WtpC [Methanoregulaceae archaeon]HPQ76452.1 tungstate ABC transporter ATP-binding protein WtpC [Methanoregulaceae archaeon]HQC12291.1 tungstate ABC transporter ATP-binding protein WtpC [Methanoregulaceae archaeon]